MAIEYAVPHYSRSRIEAAGKALSGTLTNVEEAVGIFRIAHNWRNAHVFPMRRVRSELGGIVRREKAPSGIAVARIKRMKSIRKKLRESPITLYQMNDIVILAGGLGPENVADRQVDGIIDAPQ